MAAPRPDKIVFVYNDASEKLLAAIVTQTEKERLSKPVEQHQQVPLAFLGTSLMGYRQTAQLSGMMLTPSSKHLTNWVICSGATPTQLLTDHKNILHAFAPMSLRPHSPRQVLFKVHQWAIHLCPFHLFTNHREGKDSIFADILTGCSKRYGSTSGQTNLIAALHQDIIPNV